MFRPAQLRQAGRAPCFGCVARRPPLCEGKGWIPAWLARALLVCCLFANVTAALANDPVPKEYQVKAAFLYNFAKFVEWPSQSFKNSESPLIIGVFGQNPFGHDLEAIAQNHQIYGHPIVIKQVATVAEARGVHLMFFGTTEDNRVAETLAALKGSGVLTVGESEKFIAAGGVINFIRQADKVRFEISEVAAKRQRIKISAQLLKLATTVYR